MEGELNRTDDLLFAIPKKGRLHEKCLKLLEGAGVKFSRTNRLDLAPCTNLPISLVFLPAADIAKYVGEGNIDMGITGLDMVEESKSQVKLLTELDFGKCSLALQAPIKSNIKDPRELAGGRIVTSFPHLAKKFFDEIAPDKATSIQYVSGSVEVACALGLADGIVDLVETGTTMRAAGLEIVSTIMKTEAMLISNPHTKHPELVEKMSKRLVGCVYAGKYSYITYNMPRALLSEAKKITPGNRAPTISPLEDPEWVAVSALVLKSKAAEIMDQLQAIQATDILLFDIANARV